MEGDANHLSSTSNDQLYHILKTGTFTFCLICFKDISCSSNDVGKHLKSTNHAKSIKCVFRGCNPSLVNDIEDERFEEMVLKSVFDISVLLGNETCYVCKRDEHWFCLMCEQNVVAHNLVDTIVKENVVDHVLSSCHVQKVKAVCFLYRLNDNQEFVLLNKSVVYCSVCKKVVQCEEVDLLKTAVVHLETKHSNHTSTINGLQCDTSSLVNNEDLKTTENCLPDRGVCGELLNTTNIQRNTLDIEVKDDNVHKLGSKRKSLIEIVKDAFKDNDVSNRTDVRKSFNENQFKDSNFCICLLCKGRVKLLKSKNVLVSLGNHYRRIHKKVYLETSVEDMLNSVTFHNDPNKLKLLCNLRKIEMNLKKNKHNFVLKNKTDYVCGICMVEISPCLKDKIVLSKHFQNHSNSSSHIQCEQEKIKISQALMANLSKATILQLQNQKSDFKKLQNIKEQKRVEKEKNSKIKKSRKRKQQQIGSSQVEERLDVNLEVKYTSNDDTESNRTAVSMPFNENQFFKESNFCICLICKERVKPVSGQRFLVTIGNHYKRSHKRDFMKTSCLIDDVIFHNDPNNLKLISYKRPIKKGIRNHLKRNLKTKKHINFVLKAKTDYMCIICMVIICSCSEGKTVLLKCFRNHFNSSSHHQCEKEKMKINQVFKSNLNKATKLQLKNQKTNFKKELEKIKKQRSDKKKLAKERLKKRKLQKQQIGTSKIEENPDIKQEIKYEIHQ